MYGCPCTSMCGSSEYSPEGRCELSSTVLRDDINCEVTAVAQGSSKFAEEIGEIWDPTFLP